jgi:hypothetical protein
MAPSADEIRQVSIGLLERHDRDILAIASMLNTFSRSTNDLPDYVVSTAFSTLFALIEPELKSRGIGYLQLQRAAEDLQKANRTLQLLEELFPEG